MLIANRNHVFVAAVLALACAGCGSSCGSSKKSEGEREKPDDAATMPFQTRSITARYTEHVKPPPLPQQDAVELVDAGKAPRRMFRYRPDDTPREFTIAARVASRELGKGVLGPAVTLPEIRYGLGLRAAPAPAGAAGSDEAGDKTDVKAAGKTGDNGGKTGSKTGGALFAVDLRGLVATVAGLAPGHDATNATNATNATGAAAARAAADDFLAHYRGHVERRRATVTLSDRGRIGSMTLSPDAAASAQANDIRHAIEQLVLESVVPVPGDAIGKGARWRVTTRLRRGPTVVTQKAEYELVDAGKDRLRVKARLTQIGERQLMSMPGLPPTVLAELIALFWRAEGELEVTASSLTPVAGTLAGEMRVHGRTVTIDASGNIGPPGTGKEHFLENTGTVTLSTAAPAAPPTPATPPAP